MKQTIDYGRLNAALEHAPYQPQRHNGLTFAIHYLICQMIEADRYTKLKGTINIPFFYPGNQRNAHADDIATLITGLLKRKRIAGEYMFGNRLVLEVYQQYGFFAGIYNLLFRKWKFMPRHRIIFLSNENMFGVSDSFASKGEVLTKPFMDHYFYDNASPKRIDEIITALGAPIWNFDDLMGYYDFRELYLGSLEKGAKQNVSSANVQ